MIHEGTAVLLGYDDHVTGCVLFSFYLFPVTKRLSVSKSQGIASHTICFPYISPSVCSYNHNYTNRPIWPLCNLNLSSTFQSIFTAIYLKADIQLQ